MAKVSGGGRAGSRGGQVGGASKGDAVAKPTQAKVEGASEVGAAKIADTFQVGARFAQQMQALLGKKGVAETRLTTAELMQVAQAFAGLLKQQPGADRRQRARMFAKAFLKSRKFSKIFDEADESDLEDIYDLIGDQLEDQESLAKLVDEVTEGTKRMGPGE